MKIIDATIESTQDPSKRYRCRHIFIDGRRCGSPSLRGEHLCYYHHTARGFSDEKRHRRTWTEFELPLLEDRSSVLAAITEVLQRIACDNLPSKQAGLLLYGLQIASCNLPETDEAKSAPKSDDQPVELVMTNSRYGDLAPVAEIVEEAKTAIDPHQISEQQDAPQSDLSLPKGPALEDMGEAPPVPTQPEPPQPLTLSTLQADASANGATYSCCAASEAAEKSRSFERVEEKVAALKGRDFSRAVPAVTALRLQPLRESAPSEGPIHLSASLQRKFTLNPALAEHQSCYPSNCHANEKRTPSPPHSAHRHQAAQRRRPRRCHAVDGL